MGLLKVLLTGEDEELELATIEDDASIWDEDSTDQFDTKSPSSLELPSPYDPERAMRVIQERDAVEVRDRDEVVARVGNLFLAVESLLRLLKDKGMINDLDLRRMEQQVDLEDGVADDEYHPEGPPVPSHCPKCEARIQPGKRLCQLCGHRFPLG